MSNIIEVKDLSKEFGEGENRIRVLKSLSFAVEKGEFVSIMGPSGCGKSTLLYQLGALDQPTEGQVYIDGSDINQMKEKQLAELRRKKIGFVFQFYNLVQNLSVEENILLPVIMDGKKEKDYREKLDELLKIIGLYDKKKSLPSQLSGGQQQRVSIARAVIMSPDLVLADEPIGNLDSQSGEEIMKLFKKINEEENITIVQVTHSKESAAYGNRVINLKDGNII